MKTSFNAQCNILSQLWTEYREDEEFEEFINFNDLGLPLAYFIAENIALPTHQGEAYIKETFELLLVALDLEDTGFDNLDEVFTQSDR